MKLEKADAILLALYAGALQGEGFSGVTAATTLFSIRFSKKGVHIVPDYPSKKKGGKQK